MSIDPEPWIQYARENFAVAELCLRAGYLNACLQNAQQAVEKSLKAIRSHHRLAEKRIHNIAMLHKELSGVGVVLELSREDCELLDSIYVDSKYPTPSVVPHGPPEPALCRRCVEVARRVLAEAEILVGAT